MQILDKSILSQTHTFSPEKQLLEIASTILSALLYVKNTVYKFVA